MKSYNPIYMSRSMFLSVTSGDPVPAPYETVYTGEATDEKRFSVRCFPRVGSLMLSRTGHGYAIALGHYDDTHAMGVWRGRESGIIPYSGTKFERFYVMEAW